jgi:hypothetical protein
LKCCFQHIKLEWLFYKVESSKLDALHSNLDVRRQNIWQ